MKLIQHCYNDADIVAGLCWRCFSSLCFLDSNYIHKFLVYSCKYHFNWFIFVEFGFCDACLVMPLFPCNICFLLRELITSQSIITINTSTDINNYSVLTFTMVIISFCISQGFDGVCNIFDYDIFKDYDYDITSKSLINNDCIIHVTHFSSATKFLLQNQTFFLFFLYINLFILFINYSK